MGAECCIPEVGYDGLSYKEYQQAKAANKKYEKKRRSFNYTPGKRQSKARPSVLVQTPLLETKTREESESEEEEELFGLGEPKTEAVEIEVDNRVQDVEVAAKLMESIYDDTTIAEPTVIEQPAGEKQDEVVDWQMTPEEPESKEIESVAVVEAVTVASVAEELVEQKTEAVDEVKEVAESDLPVVEAPSPIRQDADDLEEKIEKAQPAIACAEVVGEVILTTQPETAFTEER